MLGLLTDPATQAAAIVRPWALEPLAPTPTPEQRAWQELELTLFVHFGMNTFTDREWGTGKEAPQAFNPTALDCRQWARAARAGGFKLMILTAKHHDGFCLWPSRFTEHSVKHSPWKNGQGDVVSEFTEACRAEGLKVGLYLSPWDRHEPSYGTDAYNTHFTNQLGELLTHYGPVDEVWFDGACGEGPNGKKQVYDWPSYYATIRALAPHAVIAIQGPDIRWVGNESGVARPGESSVQAPRPDVHPGVTNRIWYPAECDVSIRPGWFYHPREDTKVKRLDHLLALYLKSVGRNSVLLVNVPADPRGRFADPDVQRLGEFGDAVRSLTATNLALFGQANGTPLRQTSPGDFTPVQVTDGNPATYWAAADGATNAELIVALDKKVPKTFNLLDLREAFWLGERIERYRLDYEPPEATNTWRTLARGTVIGARNLVSLPDTTARRVRLVIEAARGCPALSELALYRTALLPKRNPPPLSSQRPASASSVHAQGTTFGPDRAVDDDPDTRWATADGTRECWMEVDLGAPKHVGRVAIAEFTPRIKEFTIQTRNLPEETWRETYRGVGVGKDIGFPAVEARFVRLHILDATDSPTLWEFQVLAP